MWIDKKTEYLRNNRDYSGLLDGNDANARPPQSSKRGRSKETKFEDEDDVNEERQEYLDRRGRLKELFEGPKLTKQNNRQLVESIREEELDVDNKKKGHAERSSKNNVAPVLSTDKKKLPNDSCYGSFFGPSKFVVVKGIIEEAHAREQVSGEENASRKVGRMKPVTSSSAEKPSHDNRPSTKKSAQPAINVKTASERSRQLKESRDYSSLLNDSPLPEGAATSKVGVGGRQNSASLRVTTNPTYTAPPLEQPKRTLGVRNPGSRSPLRILQSQSQSSKLSRRPIPNQTTNDRHIADKSTSQNGSKVTSSAKPLSICDELSSTRLCRPDARKDTKPINRKRVAEVATSNGNTSSVKGRRPISSPPVTRRSTSQTLDKSLSQSDPNSRSTIQGLDRGLTQYTDTPSAHTTGRRLPQSTDNRPAQSSGGQPAQFPHRRPAIAASQASKTKHPVLTLRKTLLSTATFRPSAGCEKSKRQVPSSKAERQSLQPKPAPKCASKPPSSGHTSARECSDDPPQGEQQRKRARSLSDEESDKLQVVGVKWVGMADLRDEEEPAPKHELSRPPRSGLNRTTHCKDTHRGEIRRERGQISEQLLSVVGSNRIRFQDEASDEDDSFIDDTDDHAHYSQSLIHKLMGYDPNKYRGNDDFDDRSMEVGFRAIQAEERRSAREARLEDQRELALIEAEEKQDRLRKLNKKKGVHQRNKFTSTHKNLCFS